MGKDSCEWERMGGESGMGTLAIRKNSSMSSVERLQSSKNLFISLAYR